MSSLYVLAQTAPPSGPSQLLQMLLPMAVVVVIFYLIVWRPQSRKQSEHAALLAQLKKGDRVITASGFYGEVAKIEGEVAVLKLNDSTPVRISKQMIAALERPPAEDEKR